jgi:hypothetical protein
MCYQISISYLSVASFTGQYLGKNSADEPFEEAVTSHEGPRCENPGVPSNLRYYLIIRFKGLRKTTKRKWFSDVGESRDEPPVSTCINQGS